MDFFRWTSTKSQLEWENSRWLFSSQFESFFCFSKFFSTNIKLSLKYKVYSLLICNVLFRIELSHRGIPCILAFYCKFIRWSRLSLSSSFFFLINFIEFILTYKVFTFLYNFWNWIWEKNTWSLVSIIHSKNLVKWIRCSVEFLFSRHKFNYLPFAFNL